MIYVKSLLVGLLAVVVAAGSLLVIAVVGAAVYNMTHPLADGAIGWDPISLWIHINPMGWFIVALIFCAGFIWEYRRAVGRH